MTKLSEKASQAKGKTLSEDLGVKNPNIKEIIDRKTTPSMFDTDDVEVVTPQKESRSKEKKKEETPKQTLPKTEHFPIEVMKQQTEIATLPTKEEVKEYLDMYNYVKKSIVDPSDFIMIQRKKFMKKSGWRKFVKAFNLSIELISKNIFELENDVHAEARVRASLPNGQFVEGYAIKSKSEYYSEKYQNYGNYNLHNLVATAITRATNRAISDLVGFGEVSAEEVISSGDDSKPSTSMF